MSPPISAVLSGSTPHYRSHQVSPTLTTSLSSRRTSETQMGFLLYRAEFPREGWGNSFLMLGQPACPPAQWAWESGFLDCKY